ncbi:hypothetical protein HNP11_004157 [Tsukamurella ocularis]|nr:hypothetical protein [Tsukamurella ocularis]
MHSLVVDRLSRTYLRKAYADRKKAEDEANT